MSLKNLNVPKKTRKFILDKLKDEKTFQIYKKFESNLFINNSFIVAVSGGPDSLALSFLAKIFAIKKFLNVKFFIVDHKLRKESTLEAKYVQKILKDYLIDLNILTWRGAKPRNNIQSIARDKRYELLINEAKKYKIKNILTGHHLDDLFENFFIRMIRGSGLKGLVSLDKKSTINKINLIRPLLNFDKEDLIFISKYIFNFFVKDPSNEDEKYMRIRIRKLIKEFQINGLDKNKLFLTLKNLKKSHQALSFYVEQNKILNSYFNKHNNEVFLNESFFHQPYEVAFRSLSESIKTIGGKYDAVRGKKIDHILEKINSNSFKKETLGGCVIKKLSHTIIISKER